MQTRVFTVDARLLRELGERLVGRPHMALAELIKNAYDADARHVELTFDGDRIRVVDDGHGMDEKAFTERWMRIGTAEKVRQRRSPGLGRPLTGSKGVGRLAVQLLARRLDVHSGVVPGPSSGSHATNPKPAAEIVAGITWPGDVDGMELTEVEVEFDTHPAMSVFAAGSRHGTAIELTELTHTWSEDSFVALAREIWALQPPFSQGVESRREFHVTLTTAFPSVQESFDAQMGALMDIASATITGQFLEEELAVPRGVRRVLLPGRPEPPSNETDHSDVGSEAESSPVRVRRQPIPRTRLLLVDIRLTGAPRDRYVVEIPECQIDDLDFEIRVFDLHSRQPKGIRVDEARTYLSLFGGVHLYDNGFRLPYHGAEQDWLRLELDHARRLSRSELVPAELQIRNAMQDLPSNKRVFGAVNISTSLEQAAALASGRDPADALTIQITRDRLVDNWALDQLTRSVRLAIDLYALSRAKNKARGQIRRRKGIRPNSTEAIRSAAEVVDALRESLPEPDYQTLKDTLDSVADEVASRQDESRAYASLLGALATAGMTSLAYEHEISKQRRGITSVANSLARLAENPPANWPEVLSEQAAKLLVWRDRSNRIRDLFRPLLDEESRTSIERYNAAKVVEDVVETMAVIGRATAVEIVDLPTNLALPPGSFAAWTAVFQNLLTNAFRATVDARPPRVRIDAGSAGNMVWIRFQDNGIGMDLQAAERLFLPFERGTENTEKVEALGLGGSGLGLTIIRMITDELGCTIGFVAPEPGWSTAAKLEWRQ